MSDKCWVVRHEQAFYLFKNLDVIMETLKQSNPDDFRIELHKHSDTHVAFDIIVNDRLQNRVYATELDIREHPFPLGRG